MNLSLAEKEKWLLLLDKIIIWDIFIFILLLPFSHITTLHSIAKVLPPVAWAAKMLLRKKISLKKDMLSWPILGYVGACLFSLLHSADVYYSLKEIRSDIIAPVLLYLVIVNNIRQKHLRIIFSCFLLSASIISSYGIWAYINGTGVLSGRALLTFYSHTIAGRYLSILIILSMGLVYTVKSHRGKAGIILCLLVSSIALLLTQARQGIVATLIAGIIFALLRDKRLLLIMVLGLMLTVPFLPRNTIMRMKSIVMLPTYTNETSTMHSRYGIWQAAAFMLRDNWLWGSGFGWKNVRPGLNDYRTIYKLQIPDPEIEHAHNIFLQEWLETGLVGFIMFLWLVVSLFRSIWLVFRHGLKRYPEADCLASVTATLCGFFIMGMVTFFLRYEMVYLFWISMALFIVLSEPTRQAAQHN